MCTAGAFLFEDVGVTAFHGAIPQVKNNSNLQLLAGIAPVEAYHAAILRTLLYQKGLEPVVPYNIKVFDFVQVSAFHPSPLAHGSFPLYLPQQQLMVMERFKSMPLPDHCHKEGSRQSRALGELPHREGPVQHPD